MQSSGLLVVSVWLHANVCEQLCCLQAMPTYAHTFGDNFDYSYACSCSHVVSNCYTSNRSFKSLRMMLPVAHRPDLAERLFIILDDRTDVWKREADKKLVWQISQQESFTSYSAPAPSLERYGALFGAIHDFVYKFDIHHTNPLPDIPAAGMQHWLRHGGQRLF